MAKKKKKPETPREEKKKGFFTKPIQQLNHFIEKEINKPISSKTKLDKIDKNENTIKNFKTQIKKESGRLRSNTWAMKRAEKEKDWDKYNNLESERNRIKRIQDSFKTIVNTVNNDTRRLKGLDDDIDIRGLTNFKIKRSKLLGAKNPALVILRKQLSDLNKEKKDKFYAVQSEAQKKGLEIQMQRLRSNIKGITRGEEIGDILEDEDEDFSELTDYMEEHDYHAEEYVIFYEALPSGVIIIY